MQMKFLHSVLRMYGKRQGNPSLQYLQVTEAGPGAYSEVPGKEGYALIWQGGHQVVLKGQHEKDYGMSVIPDFTGDTAWSR